jgi:NAD(P)-dependent dehydrogenase (short-subunit alcohol dehydrogenase family)
MNNLQGRVVVITGAAGGLGGALSRGFAREGCRLFLTDKHEGRLTGIMAELAGEGAMVAGEVVDLTNVSQTQEVIESVFKIYGQIDTLVNNAGISRAMPFWDLTEEDWDHVLDVNVKALFFATRAAAKHMLARGGSIINIASVAGRLPRPTLMHYAASKAAVISITRSSALALASNNIRVNAIAPGMMDTEMFHILRSDLEESSTGSATGQPDLSIIPLGRIARPEEIAASAVFLAGDAAVYITGQTLNVCGGICMS